MNWSLKHLAALAVIAPLVASCGLFGDKQPAYYSVTESRPLQIPSGLDTPTADSALTIEYPVMPLPSEELNAVPPRILANQANEKGNAKIRWSADGVYLLVEDSPDSVQRRLGFVIERSGMGLQGRGSDGNYQFDYQHVRSKSDEGWFSWMAFWRDDPPDYSGTYETQPQPDGTNTRVYLRYADGGEVPMEAAEHVLAILMERLG